MTDVKLEILHDGAPIVNSAHLHAGSDSCVAIYVDMRSKRCEVLGWGFNEGKPVISVWAGEHALHLNEDKPRDAITELTFPDYAGWDVFFADIGRYTLSVCLVKPKDRE